MTKPARLIVLFLACDSGTAQAPDARVDRGGPCSTAAGQGCSCNRQFACPQATDRCAALGSGFGSFCANACTTKTQAVDCAMANGQLGVGACVLSIQGFLGKYCA